MKKQTRSEKRAYREKWGFDCRGMYRRSSGEVVRGWFEVFGDLGGSWRGPLGIASNRWIASVKFAKDLARGAGWAERTVCRYVKGGSGDE